MKPQEFGLTHYEKQEREDSRRVRNCICALVAIFCLAGMIEKFI